MVMITSAFAARAALAHQLKSSCHPVRIRNEHVTLILTLNAFDKANLLPSALTMNHVEQYGHFGSTCIAGSGAGTA
jgi:hypothetical protein